MTSPTSRASSGGRLPRAAPARPGPTGLAFRSWAHLTAQLRPLVNPIEERSRPLALAERQRAVEHLGGAIEIAFGEPGDREVVPGARRRPRRGGAGEGLDRAVGV